MQSSLKPLSPWHHEHLAKDKIWNKRTPTVNFWLSVEIKYRHIFLHQENNHWWYSSSEALQQKRQEDLENGLTQSQEDPALHPLVRQSVVGPLTPGVGPLTPGVRSAGASWVPALLWNPSLFSFKLMKSFRETSTWDFLLPRRQAEPLCSNQLPFHVITHQIPSK